MKTVRANNIFYWSHLNIIGGVETWLYEIAKKYAKEFDILVVYDTADKDQLERLRKLVKTEVRADCHFVCEKLFIGYATEIVEQVEAKEIWQVLHADYKAQNLKPFIDKRITGYLGVSQNTCDTFKEMTGLEAELCYNPLEKRKPKKILHLISATRITSQKAPENMVKLAEALEKENIPFIWDIYTDSRLPDYVNERIVYHAPRLDIIDYIADADYLVQLSQSEGYPYTIIEALSVGTPVIITDLPCLPDLKIENGKNAFVVPMDASEIPVKEIYKGLPKFTYTIRKDRWNELLAEGEPTYNEWLKTPVRIKTLRLYHDIPLDREMRIGEEQTVDRFRAERLIELGLAEEINDTLSV